MHVLPNQGQGSPAEIGPGGPTLAPSQELGSKCCNSVLLCSWTITSSQRQTWCHQCYSKTTPLSLLSQPQLDFIPLFPGKADSMGTVSFRDHIRWGSDPPSEPTSTLVLTSPNHYFVDIRVLKTALAQISHEASSNSDRPPSLAREHLDWAIGGTSASSMRTRPNGTQVSHSVFTHWVDSRTTEPESATDEGDMLPQPDGTTLETGRMINPATGVETDYEELWRDGTAKDVPALAKWTVLRIHDDSQQKRGMFVQLGKYAQAVLRIGDSFTAERWEWNSSSSKWVGSFRVGDDDAFPLDDLIPTTQEVHQEGDKVEAWSGMWSVLESSG